MEDARVLNQAETEIFVGRSEADNGICKKSFTPSSAMPFPILPAVVVGPFNSAATLPFPEESSVVEAKFSSNFHHATIAGVVTAGASMVKNPSLVSE